MYLILYITSLTYIDMNQRQSDCLLEEKWLPLPSEESNTRNQLSDVNSLELKTILCHTSLSYFGHHFCF